MRIRIALMTAVAVTLVPALIFAWLSSTPAASGVTRHLASEHSAARTTDLMNDAQARPASRLATIRLATYAGAVTAAQEAKYIQTVAFLQDLAFFHAVASQQAAAQPAVATPAALPVSADSGSDATSTNTPHWACIRQHESGGNYAEGGGGAYQFEFGTWHGVTGLPAPAQDYPPSVQDAAALKLFSQRGWQPWTTRYVCGL